MNNNGISQIICTYLSSLFVITEKKVFGILCDFNYINMIKRALLFIIISILVVIITFAYIVLANKY